MLSLMNRVAASIGLRSHGRRRSRVSCSCVIQPLEPRIALTKAVPLETSAFDGEWEYATNGLPAVVFFPLTIDSPGQSSTLMIPPNQFVDLNDVKIRRNVLKGKVEGEGVRGKLKIVGADVSDGLWTSFHGSIKFRKSDRADVMMDGIRSPVS